MAVMSGGGGFYRTVRIWGEGLSIPCLRIFLRNGDQLAHTNSTLYARICPQWLGELRRLWLKVP